MSLTTGEMSAADLAAVVGNGNNDAWGGNGSWWIILLFLCLFNGGWGGYGNGGNSGAGGLYPWMNQADITNSGFRDQMINDNITSIRDGIYGLSNQLCSCCGDMRDAVNSGFYSAEIAANNRQMADMQTAFAAQTAMNAGFNSLQSQLATCCCDNRLATCQTQNIIQNEGNMTRFADANNTRDIVQSISNGNQAILDKLCQLELDAKNDTISQLRQELLYARGQASQDVQTAQILAGQSAEIDGIYNRLSNCPVPSVPVYGRQNIFTCGGNNGTCGCGM